MSTRQFKEIKLKAIETIKSVTYDTDVTMPSEVREELLKALSSFLDEAYGEGELAGLSYRVGPNE